MRRDYNIEKILDSLRGLKSKNLLTRVGFYDKLKVQNSCEGVADAN